MKVTVIHGQAHNGITCHITDMLIKKAFDDPEVTEFFLPNDGPGFCSGCNICFMKGEERCPQRDKVKPIADSMVSADVIIIDSPTYCMGVSGQLKTLFDHIGYMWMSHRPDPSMFHKIGIAVSSCAGKGSDETVEFISKQMMMIGIPVTFGLDMVVGADTWEHISQEKMVRIEKEISKLSLKIRSAKPVPNYKFKIIYKFMKKNQEANSWNKLDRDHWEAQGWLNGKNPWD